MAKKRMGRPPLPLKARRVHRITLGLTTEELAKAAKLAREEGLTPSTWARKVILRALHRRETK